MKRFSRCWRRTSAADQDYRVGSSSRKGNGRSADEPRVRLDSEKLGQFELLSFRKAVLRVCTFLGIDPRAGKEPALANMIVVSDTLNYMDFRKVLRFCKVSQAGRQLSATHD